MCSVYFLSRCLWRLLAGPCCLPALSSALLWYFQAATQIQEQTLTFVPKILAIALLLFITGSAMMTTLGEFMVYLFDLSARI